MLAGAAGLQRCVVIQLLAWGWPTGPCVIRRMDDSRIAMATDFNLREFREPGWWIASLTGPTDPSGLRIDGHSTDTSERALEKNKLRTVRQFVP